MCCCGKPTINGELGYRWQPNDTPSIRPVSPPAIERGEILFDEPGRCGGMDSHCHHYRLVKNCGYELHVRHGGGDESIPYVPFPRGPEFLKALTAMDSNTRYWLLNAIYHAHSGGARDARDLEAAKWRKAAAEKRLKTRKLRDGVKVWIEPKVEAANGND